jgi:hypothetical protein
MRSASCARVVPTVALDEVDLRYDGRVENVRWLRLSRAALNGRSRFSNACRWVGKKVARTFEGG